MSWSFEARGSVRSPLTRRLLGACAIVSLLATPVFGAIAVLVGPDFALAMVALGTFGGAPLALGFAVAYAVAASRYVARERDEHDHARPALFELSDETLSVSWHGGHTRAFPLSAARAGWVNELGAVLVTMAEGSQLIVGGLPEHQRERLLRGLSVTASQVTYEGRAGLALSPRSYTFVAFGFVFITLVSAALVVWAFSVSFEYFCSVFVSCSAIGIGWLVVVDRARFCRVSVGSDGVMLKSTFQRLFVPMQSLAAVTRSHQGIHLHRHSGEETLLRDGTPVLYGRILAARALGQRGSRAIQTELLDRNGRDLRSWKDALTALRAAGEGTYRNTALPSEDLFSVALDGLESPERRVGATFVLWAREQGELLEQIRDATGACAEPALRAILEKATQGEVADKELRAAAAAFAS